MIDIVLGFLAGLVSCVTPEALLLIPLLIAAAGADRWSGLVAIAIGLGVALVGTGAVSLGIEAVWLRRLVCFLLLVQGMLLLRELTVERYRLFTGGLSGYFDMPEEGYGPTVICSFVLTIFVGGNWIPAVGATLGKASLMAADQRDIPLAFGILFAFGIGAAVPWIIVGRIVRLALRPFLSGLFTGLAGKRILGLTLIAVAVLGATGLDVSVDRSLAPRLPVWARTLAVTF